MTADHQTHRCNALSDAPLQDNFCDVCVPMLSTSTFLTVEKSCYIRLLFIRRSNSWTTERPLWQPPQPSSGTCNRQTFGWFTADCDSSVVSAMRYPMTSSPEQVFFGAAPPGCSLGTRDWTVIFHDPVISEDRIARLEEKFKDLKASASKEC